MGIFFTQNFFFLTSSVVESSSFFTGPDTLAINEIVQVLIEGQIPAGDNFIKILAGKVQRTSYLRAADLP